MEFDFLDKSTVINDIEMEENINLYPIHQQQDNIFKPMVSNSNMITTSDIYQSSSSNSNINYQSFYFSSSFDSNQYHTTENNNHFDYSSSTYSIDPYYHGFSNNYSTNSYFTQTGYSSTPMESSTYITPIDTYQNHHPIYTDSNPTFLPSSSSSSSSSSMHYQSVSSQWDLGSNKMSNHSDISLSKNSNKQPCLVCHENSSGYHFGAYTCESCKAFYRRVTKDPNIEIKHSCDIPLPNITKLNRKDCRACRKAKCDEVGMTILSKDRISRIKAVSSSSSSSSKSSSISINNLLEQLAHDLTYNQFSTSLALENLLQLLDLPLIISMNFDYHNLYINAIQIWRNQYQQTSEILINISLNDAFAVLLVLFYSFMFIKENNDIKSSTDNIKLDKLIHILQQEINRITGLDHRLACKIKALFMKSYVALAQYYPNSINLFNSNQNLETQSILPYQQYSNYNQ